MYRDRSWFHSRHWVRRHLIPPSISNYNLVPFFFSRATVFALAKRGPKAIYVSDLTLNHFDDLVKEIEAMGVQCIARAVDAASTTAVTGIIDEAMQTFGRLDVFFANAGVASGDRIQDETAESFMRMMRINALSCFLAIKHAGAAMQVTGSEKEFSGGSIICTASGKLNKRGG